jgi:hypothetical protein
VAFLLGRRAQTTRRRSPFISASYELKCSCDTGLASARPKEAQLRRSASRLGFFFQCHPKTPLQYGCHCGEYQLFGRRQAFFKIFLAVQPILQIREKPHLDRRSGREGYLPFLSASQIWASQLSCSAEGLRA